MLLLLLGCVAGARVRFAGRVCSFFLVPVDNVCVHSFWPCVCLIIVVVFLCVFCSVRVCSFFLVLNAFWLCACVFSFFLALYVCVHSFWL